MSFCRTFLVGMLLAAAGNSLVLGQESNGPDTYTEDEGEEKFGPDYFPVKPDIEGLPLYIAQPSGGIRIPASLLTLGQEAFVLPMTPWALPVEPTQRPFATGVPLLQNVRNSFPQTEAPPLRLFPFSKTSSMDRPVGNMKVHFVFVGQGAGAIIELPCGVAVVDLGGERNRVMDDEVGGEAFVTYLAEFLKSHPEYGNRVDVVFISHAHSDHLDGTVALMNRGADIRVANVVDNGQSGSVSALGRQSEFRRWVDGLGGGYASVDMAAQTTATGVTNASIDPFSCATVSAFWGAASQRLLGTKTAWEDPNNHSVVVRIDYGQASFLFVGDLMDKGIAAMLREYEENLGVFDADVFAISHHGAEGDTTDRLIEIVSPQIGVISMGKQVEGGAKTAHQYGHPNLDTLRLLQEEPFIVDDTRAPTMFTGSPGSRRPFEAVEVNRAIYGTGWEGTVIVTATPTGDFEVTSLGF